MQFPNSIWSKTSLAVYRYRNGCQHFFFDRQEDIAVSRGSFLSTKLRTKPKRFPMVLINDCPLVTGKNVCFEKPWPSSWTCTHIALCIGQIPSFQLKFHLEAQFMFLHAEKNLYLLIMQMLNKPAKFLISREKPGCSPKTDT
jgi:hypothetical protein